MTNWRSESNKYTLSLSERFSAHLALGGKRRGVLQIYDPDMELESQASEDRRGRVYVQLNHYTILDSQEELLRSKGLPKSAAATLQNIVESIDNGYYTLSAY